MTAKQRWVIIVVCGATAVTLAIVAIVAGSRGVEVFSWLAGIASLLIAVLTPVLARRTSIDPTPATSSAHATQSSWSTTIAAVPAPDLGAYGGEHQDRPADSVVVDEYLARLRQRYGHLDIGTLLPLNSQDERVPVDVRDVFVAQTVRADPPPVELPRELWRRLAGSGMVDDHDLPDDLDREMIAKARQSYASRPSRPVLDVLGEPGQLRIVVLGDPGAGKSTLARYLAVVLAQDHGEILPASL